MLGLFLIFYYQKFYVSLKEIMNQISFI